MSAANHHRDGVLVILAIRQQGGKSIELKARIAQSTNFSVNSWNTIVVIRTSTRQRLFQTPHDQTSGSLRIFR